MCSICRRASSLALMTSAHSTLANCGWCAHHLACVLLSSLHLMPAALYYIKGESINNTKHMGMDTWQMSCASCELFCYDEQALTWPPWMVTVGAVGLRFYFLLIVICESCCNLMRRPWRVSENVIRHELLGFMQVAIVINSVGRWPCNVSRLRLVAT